MATPVFTSTLKIMESTSGQLGHILSTLPVQNMSPTTSYFNSSLTGNFTDLRATKEPYIRPFDDTAIIIAAVILLSFLVLGLFGNITTIIVISTNSKLKNIFMYFILSLCVSDLWSAMISWLCLYRRTWGFDVWAPLPDVFCRFYWASDLLTSYVTSMHIFSFGLLRLISVQFPIAFGKIKLVHGKIWIISIWIFCFLFGFIPFFIFFDARTRDRLGDTADSRWPSCTVTSEWYETYLEYQKVGYPLCLYAPTAGVVVTSFLLIVTVCTRTRRLGSSKNGRKQRKKEAQAILQLILIVLSFLIGYIPFTAYEFWAVQERPNIMYYRYFDYWFGLTQYIFLRFSECLNPIFYNLGSSKMRQYTKKFLRNKICCFCPKRVFSAQDVSTSASGASCHSKTQQKTRSSNCDVDE